MPNPVSILVWRDAKTDPPTLDGSYLVKEGDYPTVLWGYDTEEGVWFIRGEIHALVMDPPTLWAEWPEPGDLTDEDVREAIVLADSALSFGGLPEDREAVDRLRAAVGGERGEHAPT